MAEAAPAAPRRKRPPPRQANVEAIEQVTPRVIRVTFKGEELADFGPPKPGAHIKLLFVPDGAKWDRHDPEAPRPPSRTYTPRRYDRESRCLEVEFVLHGDGLATGWLRTAKPGDPMYIGGPGGGYDVPPDVSDMVVVADDTAIPGAGTVIEALPKGCNVTAICEILAPDEQRPLSPAVAVSPKWLPLAGATAGTLLEREVAAMAARGGSAHWWIACEANAMRRMRAHLLKERGIDPARVHTRGYWRLGETNYPDHDYGND